MKKVKSYVKNYLKEVNDNGFSLLELVVAVGILLVLTVGGLLAYNGITKNARVAAVQSAADEVYTGAVAYDSNGQNYKEAETEWRETRNGDSIEVETWKDITGAICAEAEMPEHEIKVERGAGCDGVPAIDGGAGDDFKTPSAVLTQPCQYRPGLLGVPDRVRIFYSIPDHFGLSDIVVKASTSGLGSDLAPLTDFNLTANTQLQADGSYMTDVPSNVLAESIGDGSELEIALVVVDPLYGESEPVSVASNAGLIDGVGGTCRNLG